MTHEHPHSAAHQHAHATPDAPLADASVRSARAGDVPAVGLVQAAVWRAAYSTLLPAEVLDRFEGPAFAKAWRSSLDNPPSGLHRLLVACAGDQVAGFVAVGPTADTDAGDAVGEVLALGVHPDARRQGHGSRLLNAAVDTLRGKGAVRLHAWLLATDEETRAFLQAGGLRADGAYRDRVVAPDGTVAREVRLVANLSADPGQE